MSGTLCLSTLVICLAVLSAPGTWAQDDDDAAAATVAAEDDVDLTAGPEGSPPVAVLPRPSASGVTVEDVQPPAPLSRLARRESEPELTAPLEMAASGIRFPPRGPGNRRQDARCWLNGRWVSHGTVAPYSYANPCWTKLCWYGDLADREDGCHYQGQCYPINRNFYFRCHTMSCTKSSNGRGRHSYRVAVVESRCEDSRGRCRGVGATGFSSYIDGVRYNNCRCDFNGGTRCYNDY